MSNTSKLYSKKMELKLSLLGPFAASLGGEPLTDFRNRKTQALLIYLAVEGSLDGQRRPHQREQLMELLWPAMPPQSAQVNLRQSLYQLRQMVPEISAGDGSEPVPLLMSDRQTVWLQPKATLQLDVAAFLKGVESEDMETLARAAKRFRDDFLVDFYLPDSETFEEWAAARRAGFRRLALEALARLANHHLEQLDHETAERYARRQLEIDNLREGAHRQLIQALAQRGSRNAALIHYEAFCALLEEELGIGPSAEMEALVGAVREGEMAATSVVRPQAEAKREHRLPYPTTPLVGRQREMEEVTKQVGDGCPLVTLLGPGGSGKTRLGIEVARQCAAGFRHGTVFVELAPLSDPAAIPTAIATALDFRFTVGGSPKEQVLNYLANKELLLVLDNFEHLLDGAELVSDLLEAAPAVCTIATSRTILKLGSEYVFEVGGLALPEDEDSFEAVEAVAMFLAQGRRVQPGFSVDEADKPAVADICRLVAGMPLALELAASWVRYLSPAEIARELAKDLDFLESARADLPKRQQSMRAAFDHSWRLLDEPQRDALMKLSVFQGGVTRQAASAVTGVSLRTLATLIDHSLLSRDQDSGRFAVHELLRQFAREQLEEAGEAEAVRNAHSVYYLRALTNHLPHLKGHDQLGALDDIERDFENVRAAWRWATEQRRWKHIPEASQSIFLFTLFRDRYFDGIELFEAVGHVVTSYNSNRECRVYAYTAASQQVLASYVGLGKAALASVPRLQAAIEALATPSAIAYCRLMLGQILAQNLLLGERLYEAIEIMEAACAYYQQEQDLFYLALTLQRLGFAHEQAGRPEEAADFYHRSLMLAQKIGDRFVAAMSLKNLGFVTWTSLEGPTEAALSYYRRAATLEREIGWDTRYANSLVVLAGIAGYLEGDLVQVRTLLGEALEISSEHLVPGLRVYVLLALSELRLREGDYDEVLALTEDILALSPGDIWANMLRGIALLALGQLNDAIQLMRTWLSRVVKKQQALPFRLPIFLPFLGIILARQGEHEWAAELLALGLTHPHYGRTLADDPLLTRFRAELEEILGEERFAAAWQRGKELDAQVTAKEVLEALDSSA